MNAFLKQIQLSNYRSCTQTTINLQPNLSTLIGVNGSGKSNVLNGITLLSKMLHARQYLDERGNQFICKLKASFDVNGKTIKHEAVIRYTNNDKNVDNVIDADEKWNFVEFTDDNTWVKAPISFISNLKRLMIRSASGRQLSLFDNEIGYAIRYNADRIKNIDTIQNNYEKILPAVNAVRELISGIIYYGASQFTDPSKCPPFFEIDSDRIKHNEAIYTRNIRSGRNEHSQFMHDLYLAHKKESPRYKEFISVVGKSGIGLIDKIAYREVKAPSRKYEVYTGGKIIRREATNLLVIPTITVKGTRLSPNQLSEGTFKTLAIIFYLVTDESRLLLLEEPEVCVHHGLLGSVMQLVKDFSREKQIVISTHSEFVLDGLEPSNVFVVKYEKEKGTVVKHVPSSMSKRDYSALKEYLNSDGNLGEYWRHGDLENGK